MLLLICSAAALSVSAGCADAKLQSKKLVKGWLHPDALSPIHATKPDVLGKPVVCGLAAGANTRMIAKVTAAARAFRIDQLYYLRGAGAGPKPFAPATPPHALVCNCGCGFSSTSYLAVCRTTDANTARFSIRAIDNDYTLWPIRPIERNHLCYQRFPSKAS